MHRDVLAERDLNQESAVSQERPPETAISAQRTPAQQQVAGVDTKPDGTRESASAADSQAKAQHHIVGRDLGMQEQSSMLPQQHIGRQFCRAPEQRPPHLKSTCRAPLLVRTSACILALETSLWLVTALWVSTTQG